MISEVNIISGKTSVVSVNGAGGYGGGYEFLSKNFRGQSPLKKFSGSKEHLNWLEIDLNAAEIITAQDYKSAKH